MADGCQPIRAGRRSGRLRSALAERYPVARRTDRSALINVWRLSFPGGRVGRPRVLGMAARRIRLCRWLSSDARGSRSGCGRSPGFDVGVGAAVGHHLVELTCSAVSGWRWRSMILLPLPPCRSRAGCTRSCCRSSPGSWSGFCVSSAPGQREPRSPGKPPLGAVVQVRVAIKVDMVLAGRRLYEPGAGHDGAGDRPSPPHAVRAYLRRPQRGPRQAFYKSVAWVGGPSSGRSSVTANGVRPLPRHR